MDAVNTLATEADRALAELDARKQAWLRVDLEQRERLLRVIAERVAEVAPEWVRLSCLAKGIDPASPFAGEEWLSGPMPTIRACRLLAHTLRDLRVHGGSRLRVRPGPGDRSIAHAFPHTLLDYVAYSRIQVDVWIQPGKPPTQGRIYREKAAGHGHARGQAGRVALVLGAGNISSIGPLDVLTKLFGEDDVVLLKLNPVNDYLAPVFAEALAPLIEEHGVLRIVKGGADLGGYLCRHPLVDTIHMTGSARTHDAIVWGATPAEQEERRRTGRPAIDKPITSELGCVTPVIVVPGRWSASDISFQARHVAGMVAHNASFNCNAGKVLVLARDWPRREAFLAAVEDALRRMPPRRAYYPGAEQRYRTWLEHYPRAQVLGREGEGIVPWTLVRDVPPRVGEYALTEEPFCGVLAEVSLDAHGIPEFLGKAVRFANEAVWGTLSCVVLIDGRTRRSQRAAFEHALAELRYGNIGVNAWTGANFAFGVTAWGAYPGHTLGEIGSGRGTVHNTFLLDHPEKSILHAPFRLWPTPIWFADHRNLDEVGRRLVEFERRPSWLQMPGLALAARNR